MVLPLNQKDTVTVEEILKAVLFSKTSPVYLSSNVTLIKRYLKSINHNLTKDQIKLFVQNIKSAPITYKNSSFSERCRSEESKIFSGRPKPFFRIHADTLVLSKKKNMV